METHFNENLSSQDRVIRAFVGITLVVGSSLMLVLSPAMIASLCLLAAYPLMTAMIGLDPIITAASSFHKKLSAPNLRPLTS